MKNLALAPKYVKYPPFLSGLPPPAFTVSFDFLSPEGHVTPKICNGQVMGVSEIFVYLTSMVFKISA